MRRSLALAALLLAGFPMASVRAEGWLSADKLPQALKDGAARGIPVVVLYQNRDSLDRIHDSTVQVFENYADLADMIRVRVYQEVGADGLAALQSAAHATDLPVLYMSDGEGRLIGFASHKTPVTDLRDAARLAKDAAAWKKTVRGQWNVLDDVLKRKDFAALMTRLEAVAVKDIELARVVRMGIALAEKRAAGKAAKGGVEPAKPLATGPGSGLFFDAEVGQWRSKLKETVDQECQTVEALLASGEARKAKAAIGPLLKLKLEEATVERIKDLNKRTTAAVAELTKKEADAKSGSPASKATPAGG